MVDDRLGDQAEDRLGDAGVVQALGEPVPDHSLGLGDEHIKGVGAAEGVVVLAFHGEHADLWSVAVADDQLMLTGDGCECLGCGADVAELDAGVGFFPAL
jgi:hypothetical protein